MLEQKENSSNKTDPINLRRRQVPGLLHVQQSCTRSRNDTGRKKVMYDLTKISSQAWSTGPNMYRSGY